MMSYSSDSASSDTRMILESNRRDTRVLLDRGWPAERGLPLRAVSDPGWRADSAREVRR